MKKYISTFLLATIVAVSIPMFAGSATAQRRDRYRESRDNYDNGQYTQNDDYNGNGYGYNQPKVYDRHRKAINLTVATGAGAIIGALLGGKKGTWIGAAAGVATGAIITKKQQPRNYNYRY